MEKLLLSPEEAAEALGVGRSRVYDLMRNRELAKCADRRSRGGFRLAAFVST